MTKPRYPDWAARLHNYFHDIKAQPFSWEANNCLSFALGAVKAQTGQDFSKKYPKFKTAEGALKSMLAKKFKDLDEALSSVLEAHEHPSQAQVGDIGLIKKNDAFGYSVGIINGETALFLSDAGSGIVSREDIVKAFKVG